MSRSELEKHFETLKSEGVVIIENVIPKSECDAIVDEAISVIERLGSKVDRNRLAETWTEANLLPQTRPGMYQVALGRSRPFERLRNDSRIDAIFKDLYSRLYGSEVNELVTSLDGVTLKPGSIGPYATGKDWPHVDQSLVNDTWACLQGQVVLANTSAAFMCSPKSHLLWDELRSELPDKDHVRVDDHVAWFQRKLRKIGGQWQVPIHGPAGSVIIWPSSMVHSAKLQDSREFPTEEDRFFGWRCVSYICKRPMVEFTDHELGKLEAWRREGRTTNHWGLKTLDKTPKQFRLLKKCHPSLRKFVENPRLIQDL